jgi:hypothetical protein
VSEPLMKCRDLEMTSKPGCQTDPGMSLAGARLLARWCPACRRREPGPWLLYETWEGVCRYRVRCLSCQGGGHERECVEQQKL